MNTCISVTVVEDEVNLQFLLGEVLREGGFTITKTRSGEEAMSMLNEEGADYRALVTDITLRGSVTGWDVARHAREINDKLPVVYITGAIDHDWASRGVPNSKLMPKPFSAVQVGTAVSELISAVSAFAH